MKLIVAAIVLTLTACSTQPRAKVKLVPQEEVRPMSRDEVILAISECEAAKTNAVLTKVPVSINGHKSNMVVDITCSPKYER